MATASPIGSHDGRSPSGVRAPARASVLSLSGVTKRFGTLVALDSVSLEIERGEVHCLLGENGAGKSTLCNVVFGVHRPDSGTMELSGARFEPKNPGHALSAGVAMVHQHFALVGNMTVLENLVLGRRQREEEVAEHALTLARRFGFELELRCPVERLSVGERQRIEIIKCLITRPALLVLDEPTAVLPPREVDGLLDVCRRVANDGAGVVLVTHKLAEIGKVADRTTVLRRGAVVETAVMRDADLDALVRAMVGRAVKPLSRRVQGAADVPAAVTRGGLSVEELSFADPSGVERLRVSFDVRPGEIVGIAGVEGNGQSELAAILSGMLEPSSGSVSLGGTPIGGKSPRELTRLGVGCVTEDRHATGCHLGLTVAENLFLGSLHRFTRFGLLDRKRMHGEAEVVLRAFDVRGTPDGVFGALSGGNQQKVVLARELGLPNLAFLLAAQPTRGLDVGAVEAVYAEIRRARERGAAVLVISSELEELLEVADRVLVMYRGRIVGEVPGGLEHHETVGLLMSGQSLRATEDAA